MGGVKVNNNSPLFIPYWSLGLIGLFNRLFCVVFPSFPCLNSLN